MIYRKLNQDTIDIYIDYLKVAMREAPNEMITDTLDEEGIRKRITDPFFQRTTSILAIDDEGVIGRIEFHFYGCIQDGYKMAYVDWVYVLPKYRRRGVAQSLFREFEKECVAFGIDQYYLIRSLEHEADRFYNAFSSASLTTEPILRKYMSDKSNSTN